jgi:hypothetical protein
MTDGQTSPWGVKCKEHLMKTKVKYKQDLGINSHTGTRKNTREEKHGRCAAGKT